jgi:hypothetical protein
LAAVLALLAEDFKSGPDLHLLAAAGVRVVFGIPTIIGNPGSDGLTSWPSRLDLDCDDSALRRWKARLPAAVLAEAVPVLPGKPRQGRNHKLGARVSAPAIFKLRGLAKKNGVSESEALDALLLSLP